MAHQRGRSGRPTDYDWELARGTGLSTVTSLILQFEIFVSDTAETLMRLRGQVIMRLTGSIVAADLLAYGWGVVRAASGSSDVGVSPLTEGGANWLAYGCGHLFAGDANQDTDIAYDKIVVDSKAMRKLRENESLYFIAETADVVGAPTWDVAFSLRALTGR